MVDFKSKSINEKKGFTLIELLVVIAIIGLLSSITLISFGRVRAEARDVKRKEGLNQIKTALELYYNKKEQYPFSNIGVPQEWIFSSGCGSSYYSHSTLTNFLQDLVDEELFSSVPRDPINSSNHIYIYTNWSMPLDPENLTCTNTFQQYSLIAVLEKQQPIGGDPDCNPAIAPPICVYTIIRSQGL